MNVALREYDTHIFIISVSDRLSSILHVVCEYDEFQQFVFALLQDVEWLRCYNSRLTALN